jgi:uncharacterized protein (DUF1697 family)
MHAYILLFRGINVGGKNKVPMAALKACLEERGYQDVLTYIASGNVIVRSRKSAEAVRNEVETALPGAFKLDSELVKVLVLTPAQLKTVIEDKPKGFGESPDTYHSDAIFLIDIGIDEAMRVFDPKEGVDTVWPGTGVIYSQRVSALRVKSRLGKIIGTKPYASMTIRSWNTTTKLMKLVSEPPYA